MIDPWPAALWTHLKSLCRTISVLHDTQAQRPLTALEARILADTKAARDLLEQDFWPPLVRLLEGESA